MTRPNPIVMFMGAPLLAPPLFLAFAALALNWRAFPWWVCLISASLALRTFSAFFERRRFKRWMDEWERMNAPLGKPETPAKAGRGLPALAAMALVVILPMFGLVGAQPSAAAGMRDVLWFISACYLVFVAARFLLRRSAAAKTVEATSGKSEAAPLVTWALPKPRSSPSRQEIEAKLPENVARLIRASREREKEAEAG